jgi:hypothetical protein
MSYQEERLSVCRYNVNLERQAGFLLSSTFTSGFLFYTLTNQYTVHDLGKLITMASMLTKLLPFSALRK